MDYRIVDIEEVQVQCGLLDQLEYGLLDSLQRRLDFRHLVEDTQKGYLEHGLQK